MHPGLQPSQLSNPYFYTFCSLPYYLFSLMSSAWASLVTQMVKNLPAMQETWVRSLGWDDSLEEGMATHSSILAWEIPQTEEPGRLPSMGSQRVGHSWVINTFTFHFQCYLHTLQKCILRNLWSLINTVYQNMTKNRAWHIIRGNHLVLI